MFVLHVIWLEFAPYSVEPRIDSDLLDKGDFPGWQNFLASNESQSGKYASEGPGSTKGTGRFPLSAL